MDPWKHESQFGDFIAESSTFPTAPPSPTPDHKPSQPRKEDLDAFTRTLQQLQKLETHVKQSRQAQDAQSVAQLMSFLKGARKVSPAMSANDQFERLRPLRNWLFWLPVLYLQQTAGSPNALVIIAHYYTVALMMERLFPEIGAAYFGSLSIGPVEEIARRLFSINISGDNEGQASLQLMEFPIDTVKEFRSRMGWIQPTRTPSFPQFNPPNFSMAQDIPMSMTTTSSSEYLPYGDNPPFSYSTEDLSVMAEQPASSNVGISPLALSSPFYQQQQQYLNIPSPAYGAAYSPASSTFGDFENFADTASVVYSDTDEYASFEMNYAGNSPGMGGSSNYGLGFVSPLLQTAWI